MSNDLQISLIQTSPVWEDIPANLALFEKKIAGLSAGQIVVLPEMFTTGFSMNAAPLAEEMNGKSVAWMKRMARNKQIILTGSLIIQENGHFFNRLFWVLPNGLLAYYDKRHLFSYADENKHYTPGSQKLTASVMGWKVGLFICYDLRFPVWMRQPPEPGERYDLLIIAANWPASRIDQWKTLLSARAIENQCYVAGVNRTGADGYHILYNGHSAVFDPQGKEISSSGKEEIIIQQTLKKDKLQQIRSTFPFLPDADHFVLKR